MRGHQQCLLFSYLQKETKMKTKRKRKAQSNVKNAMFIQNCWLPVELSKSNHVDHSIKSAFCFKDRLQWFYLIKSEKGFADFEKVKCECCKGDLWRDVGYESGFSASDTPEEFACLLENPNKKKTLVLAFIQSSMQPQKEVLLDHLLKHDFSGLYSELIVIQAGLKFLKSFSKKQSIKKLISTAISLNTIKLKKHRKPAESYSTRINKSLEERPSEKENKKDRLNRMKSSALAKAALKKWLKNTNLGNTNRSYKKFKNKKGKLQLQSATLNLENETKNYKSSGVRSSKNIKRLFRGYFLSSSLIQLRKANRHPIRNVVKGTGSISNSNGVGKKASR